MSRVVLPAVVSIIGILLFIEPALAQVPSPNLPDAKRAILEKQKTEERLKLEKWEQDAHKAAQAKAEKRAACVNQAKERGLHFYNRHSFMKQCLL
jgi:hypothetical protein